MGYYGSEEWRDWVIDYIPKMMNKLNRPLFIRRGERAMWLRKLRRLGYAEDADRLVKSFVVTQVANGKPQRAKGENSSFIF